MKRSCWLAGICPTRADVTILLAAVSSENLQGCESFLLRKLGDASGERMRRGKNDFGRPGEEDLMLLANSSLDWRIEPVSIVADIASMRA